MEDRPMVHATGWNSDISRAESFFGIYPAWATAPDHSCMHTNGVSPLRYTFPATQCSSRNAAGPYLQYSRDWPSDPGAQLFGCRQARRSNDSKSIVWLIRGRDPAGILSIASSTCLGIGQGGMGATAASVNRGVLNLSKFSLNLSKLWGVLNLSKFCLNFFCHV